MKLALLILVLANLLLFAYQRELLGLAPDTGREPQRAQQQVAPDKLRVLTAAQVARLRTTAQPGKDGAPGQSCMEFGDFTADVLPQLQARLVALGLKERIAPVEVEAPGWFLVYMPPLKTRADADARVREVRQATGIKDIYVIGGNSPLANGIALGSFRDRELGASFLADIESRGVKGARMADRPSTVGVTRFRARDVDAALAQQLARLQDEFPQQKLAPCAN